MEDSDDFQIPDKADPKTQAAFQQARTQEAIVKTVQGSLVPELLPKPLSISNLYLNDSDEPNYNASEQKSSAFVENTQDFETLFTQLTSSIEPKALLHSKEWYMAEITRLHKVITTA
jgi:hypothetical protein